MGFKLKAFAPRKIAQGINFEPHAAEKLSVSSSAPVDGREKDGCNYVRIKIKALKIIEFVEMATFNIYFILKFRLD